MAIEAAILLQTWRTRAETALAQALPAASLSPQRLHAAMRYATLGNGKRVRAQLVYASGAALGLAPESLDLPACAVELIHAYSLVHDDLPAMDDDTLRRGQPCCHIAFDEATAILAGDALQTLAFQVLTRADAFPAQIRLAMLDTLTLASGSRGMAGGQALDMAAVGQTLNLPELEDLHIHKTGALLRACVKLGWLGANTTPAQVQALEHYAKALGLAYQIRDDILDVEGDSLTLGKTGGKDRQQNKPTYPALLGLAEAKAKATALHATALTALQDWDERAEPLRTLAHQLALRTR